MPALRFAPAAAFAGCMLAVGCDSGSACGPTEATVTRIIDGDTVELDSGETIRYLLVNTPETTGGKNECYGSNAVQFNTDLVLGKTVELTYDTGCTDRFDRLLAYVSVAGQEVNSLLIERGYGCVLHIAPNGDDRIDELEALEAAAKAAGRGLWG
ncbi:MAG: thermonuclease family protein, partial [Kofleriaceae bacterium]